MQARAEAAATLEWESAAPSNDKTRVLSRLLEPLARLERYKKAGVGIRLGKRLLRTLREGALHADGPAAGHKMSTVVHASRSTAPVVFGLDAGKTRRCVDVHLYIAEPADGRTAAPARAPSNNLRRRET